MNILIPLSEVKKLPIGFSKVPLGCKVCGKTFHAPKKEVLSVSRGKRKKKTLESCSRRCALALSGSNTRSLPEVILYEMITAKYPTLKINRNDRDTLDNGLELDLYIPSINLAIEVNGPTHYDNIFGELKLLRTELNDLRKKDKSEQLGITLKIMNISDVKEKELRNFIAIFFLEEVLSLLPRC